MTVSPRFAVPGGRVTITGSALPPPLDGPPRVRVGDAEARVAYATPCAIQIVIPTDCAGGRLAIRVGDGDHDACDVVVARTLATDVHHVDSPLFDASGR